MDIGPSFKEQAHVCAGLHQRDIAAIDEKFNGSLRAGGLEGGHGLSSADVGGGVACIDCQDGAVARCADKLLGLACGGHRLAGEVGFGGGRAWSEDLLVDARFVHSAERPATVLLRVPEPYDFDFVTVDTVTGERTPHARADVGFGVGGSVRGAAELTAIEPGRFLATAIAERVYVGVPSAHGYLETNVQVDARAGGVVEVRLEPIPSILVGMVSSRPGQGNVPWPRDVEPVLWREDAPDAEWRYEFEGDGVRFWVDRESFWMLKLPDLPGFRTGQTTNVWFGADTELERQPVGLEAE